jgi:hypothetical protein
MKSFAKIFILIVVCMVFFFIVTPQRIDSTSIDTFESSLDIMAMRAKYSDDVTPDLDAGLSALKGYMQIVAIQVNAKISRNNNLTKGDIKHQLSEQMLAIIKPYNGLTLEDFSSRTDKFKQAQLESKIAEKKATE